MSEWIKSVPDCPACMGELPTMRAADRNLGCVRGLLWMEQWAGPMVCKVNSQAIDGFYVLPSSFDTLRSSTSWVFAFPRVRVRREPCQM